MLVELAAGLALAVVAARASSAWELAALAWLALLAVAALTTHQPAHLGRAAIGGTALACFYLALSVLPGGGMGLGDVKLAASIGAALAWVSWQALLTGTFTAFVLAGVYGGILLARHRATRSTHMALGPFILIGGLAAIVL